MGTFVTHKALLGVRDLGFLNLISNIIQTWSYYYSLHFSLLPAFMSCFFFFIFHVKIGGSIYIFKLIVLHYAFTSQDHMYVLMGSLIKTLIPKFSFLESVKAKILPEFWNMTHVCIILPPSHRTKCVSWIYIRENQS